MRVAQKTEPEKLSFEDALNQLEDLVSQMEEGDVPLATLLEKFEEGNKLIKICASRLKDAELKIEILKKAKEADSFENFDPDKE